MSTTPPVPSIKLDENINNSDAFSDKIPVDPFRPSMESTVSRYTSTSTIFTSQYRNQFSLDSKSGSRDYSPLGNNSIHEIVMNTRQKDWLRLPQLQ